MHFDTKSEYKTRQQQKVATPFSWTKCATNAWKMLSRRIQSRWTLSFWIREYSNAGWKRVACAIHIETSSHPRTRNQSQTRMHIMPYMPYQSLRYNIAIETIHFIYSVLLLPFYFIYSISITLDFHSIRQKNEDSINFLFFFGSRSTEKKNAWNSKWKT